MNDKAFKGIFTHGEFQLTKESSKLSFYERLFFLPYLSYGLHFIPSIYKRNVNGRKALYPPSSDLRSLGQKDCVLFFISFIIFLWRGLSTKKGPSQERPVKR